VERLAHDRGAAVETVLMRCALGLGAVAGVAQVFALDQEAQALSWVAATLFYAAALTLGVLRLNSASAPLRNLKNPDAPMTLAGVADFFYLPLLLVQLFLALAWSPGRLVDVLAGFEAFILAMAALSARSTVLSGAVRGTWNARRNGVVACLSGLSTGLVLFGTAWAVAGDSASFEGLRTLLALGCLGTAAHWLTAVRYGREAASVLPGAFLDAGTAGQAKAYLLASLLPVPFVTALAGVAGTYTALAFPVMLIPSLWGLWLERMLFHRLAVRSKYFAAVGGRGPHLGHLGT
jgi:hypothetical protein